MKCSRITYVATSHIYFDYLDLKIKQLDQLDEVSNDAVGILFLTLVIKYDCAPYMKKHRGYS